MSFPWFQIGEVGVIMTLCLCFRYCACRHLCSRMSSYCRGTAVRNAPIAEEDETKQEECALVRRLFCCPSFALPH